MGWQIFQILIVIAVTWSNAEHKWTDNHIAAAIVGWALAYIATKMLIWLSDLPRRLLACVVGNHRANQETGGGVARIGQGLNTADTIGPGQKKVRKLFRL